MALELVFPSQYVDQTALEQFDGVSAGKYTIGLGQERMGFCTEIEDINSLCLTVTAKLLERHGVAHSRIGHLEVGTETIIDKSKSVKTVLMQLFSEHGVSDLEGIDTTNACYGGTAALFNAINWVESSSWDGRLALVVCADIAIYAKGTARPTGGVGAVAMLIGPNAPLVLDRGVRSSFMEHAYDFYKPDLTSEYPTVDGKLSIQCYLKALDNCYQLYRKKYAKLHPEVAADKLGLASFDAVLFHTPYCKLVQKSLARIGVNDFFLASAAERADKFPEAINKLKIDRLEDTYFDRDIEKAFLGQYNAVFEAKTKSALYIANLVGNMYTASLYAGLVSYLTSASADELAGKHIALFSYGSGLASTMYSVSVTANVDELKPLVDRLSHVRPLLEQRRAIAPKEFDHSMESRAANHHKAPYTPVGDTSALFPGTYYLTSIDDMHRRTYARKE